MYEVEFHPLRYYIIQAYNIVWHTRHEHIGILHHV